MTTAQDQLQMNQEHASHFAALALKCMQQEYPNKLNQVLGDGDDLQSPKTLHPAFYGCFDWHSSVHGHWMLVKLLKEFPELPEAQQIRTKLDQNLTAANIAGEVTYFEGKHNQLFERTYGWAWLLQLATELHTWDDEQGQQWAKNLQPLTDLIVERYKAFLPKLTYPIRTGEHPNTAFGLTFAHDYAAAVKDDELLALITERCKTYYGNDQNGPLAWEPGGFDFLSPCLEEAEIMARVLPQAEYKIWLEGFLPALSNGTLPMSPAVVSDRTDGKIVHLDGLNLSRAWCLYRIAEAYPEQQEYFSQLADEHLNATLPNIQSGDYAGEHWLASFAIYALFSRR